MLEARAVAGPSGKVRQNLNDLNGSVVCLGTPEVEVISLLDDTDDTITDDQGSTTPRRKIQRI